MIIDLDKITDVCIKLKINYHEFCFLYLVYTRDYDNINRYVSKLGEFSTKFRSNLVDRLLIVDMNNPNNKNENGVIITKVSKLHVSSDFSDILKEIEDIKDSDELYNELCEVYPWEFKDEEKGRTFNARTGTTELNSIRYMKIVEKNPSLHKEIINITKYGAENGLIRTGLEKYIDGRLWGSIKEKMDMGMGSTTSDLE